MEKTVENKSKIQPGNVPTICPKCNEGKLESQCGGRVYICSNPKCKAGMWVKLKE